MGTAVTHASQQQRRSLNVLVGPPGCAALCGHGEPLPPCLPPEPVALRLLVTFHRDRMEGRASTMLCGPSRWQHTWPHISRLGSSEWERCPWPHLLPDQGCCRHSHKPGGPGQLSPWPALPFLSPFPAIKQIDQYPLLLSRSVAGLWVGCSSQLAPRGQKLRFHKAWVTCLHVGV